ncbi:hypothetical protein CDL12_24077 [Handroanthus impetiginosus]|uniref:Uncharacterized protein n=1 Tax=Handroanthus impetiginosus TaxID=429701 RepID=A0A2G9GDX0_9LAMI|nr:hypothetical protein CDL12_24077 [Handroanthus impetiginosus]
MQAVQCPAHSFRYNSTLCSCNPGFVYNLSSKTCDLFAERRPAVEQSSGVDYDSSLAFPETIFAFNSIKRFTQSQAVFLEATLVMLLFWLGFCLLLRLFPLGSDGRSPWFKIRWWISRLDISFATRHWLHDQKPVIKRKTELGGAFSIASWILFIGLFAALLYQIISKRSVEMHNVRSTSAADLAAFLNDLEFNITTISSMSCAQLRGLDTLVTGNPAFIDNRVLPLSTFANYSCFNTTTGPTITIHCNNCRLIPDFSYVSWQFVDLPNNPATAVGFQFNLTAKNHADKKHMSFVSGTLKNASNYDVKPITYRGPVPNIMKFNLFPRIYHNLHNLRLIQPLFHEFLPGSYFSEVSQLQASVENSDDGLINTTLSVNFLSAYIIEINNQNVLGPVSFLADLGGLYCISIGIFFYFLVQCEYRIKSLRSEDSTMRKIRNRRKAQDRWEKLRKYVMYTWGSSLLDDNYRNETNEACCAGVMRKTLHQRGSSHKQKLPNRMDAVSFSRKVNLPNEKKNESVNVHSQEVGSRLSEPALNLEERSSLPSDKPEGLLYEDVEHKNDDPSLSSHPGGGCQNQGFSVANIANVPPLLPLDHCNSQMDAESWRLESGNYKETAPHRMVAAADLHFGTAQFIFLLKAKYVENSVIAMKSA